MNSAQSFEHWRASVFDALLPHQPEAVDFLAARRLAILGDEMGLGKTVEAIRACDLAALHLIVVIAPKSMCRQWAREWARWQKLQRPIKVLETRRDAYAVVNGVNIVSWSLLAGLVKSLKRVPWQLIIADEAQYAKNSAAVRTVALYGPHASGHGLVQSTQRIWLLSGGLAPNNPAELWTHLYALCPAAIGHAKLHQFIDRYCITRETDFGQQIVGAKNTDELLAILNSIRLARSSRLLNLPPLNFGEIVLEPTQVVSRALAHACGIYATEAQQLAAVQSAEELEALSNQPSALRHEVGRIKAPMIANMMTEELHHYDHKLILFGWHIDVLDYLAQQLAPFGVVRVIGEDSATARERAKLTFQSEPGVRVFIGQIIAGGLGIDLTASNQVVFAELSWSPLDNLQAAKRPHRIGQIWPCYARSISLANSLDERIDAVLMRKLKMINALHNVENRYATTPFRG